MTTDEKTARDRVQQACRMIRSAYRLHPLDPVDTIISVRSAIEAGTEDLAADLMERARRA